MGTPKLVRQSQVLGKLETVAGSYEALTASEGKVRMIVGAAAEHAWPTEPRNIARGTLANLGSLPSTKATNINFSMEMNTPDTITSTMEETAFLAACGMTVTDLYSIPIGAVATGPFKAGEKITTTGKTGYAMDATANGDSSLYFTPISGTFTSSEILAGEISGASATASSTATTVGHAVRPVSDNQQTISIELQEDGLAYSATGAMANVTATFENSKAGYFEFSFMGPKNNSADKAMTTGITRNTEQPPILQGAAMKINSVTPVVSKAVFDLGNNVVLRPDANATATGFISAYISAREPKVTISFEVLPTATLDVFALMAAGTEVPIQWQLGTVSGKLIYFFASKAQVINISLSDQGIRTYDVEFSLNGTAASDDFAEFILAYR